MGRLNLDDWEEQTIESGLLPLKLLESKSPAIDPILAPCGENPGWWFLWRWLSSVQHNAYRGPKCSFNPRLGAYLVLVVDRQVQI
jgi:hypothetical protein